jgi:tetratricopeptide (TPR) repeat protein
MLSSPSLRIGLVSSCLALASCAAPEPTPASAPAAAVAAYGTTACTRTPKPADVTAAKGAHKAAARFYERGAWDDAIRCWADAYSFDCTAHDLLVNIANALEKKGDRRGALATLEAYLEHKPNPEIAERVRKLREALGTPPR